MSNVLSISAVTAVFKDLLENGLVSDAIVSSMGDVVVTALPPDRVSVEADERPQLNLFLYQISPNRNADWSVNTADKLYARSPTNRTATPPLALDLYYLLTAYGAKDFQAELLLGYAINLLYKIPMLNGDRIETALTNATKVSSANVFSQSLSAISTAELAQNLGQLKISSEFLSLDEMSRLWSLFQTHYRPSTAYRVSMVAMPERQEYQAAGTKSSARWRSLSSGESIPQIDRVTSMGDRSITTDNILLIRGRDLRGEITRIRLDKKEIVLSTQDVTPTQISCKIPLHLAAGVQEIQVLHSSIESPDLYIESNLASFVLHPQIAATVTKIDGQDRDVRSVEITVKFNPQVNRSQQVILLLYQVSNLQEIAYRVIAKSIDTATDLLTFNLSNISPGNYLVQAKVDGAESLDPSELQKRRVGKHEGMQIVIT
jgi:Pvc16 N-terminal domain